MSATERERMQRERERLRRMLICAARERVLDAMYASSPLTPLEWLEVMGGIEQRLRTEGLVEEWKEISQ